MMRLSQAALASERLREDESARDDALQQRWRENLNQAGDGADAAQDGWQEHGSDSPIGDWDLDLSVTGPGGAERRTGEQLLQLTRAAMAVEALRSLDIKSERETEMERLPFYNAVDSSAEAQGGACGLVEDGAIERWGSGGRESEEEYGHAGKCGWRGQCGDEGHRVKVCPESPRPELGIIANPLSSSENAAQKEESAWDRPTEGRQRHELMHGADKPELMALLAGSRRSRVYVARLRPGSRTAVALRVVCTEKQVR